MAFRFRVSSYLRLATLLVGVITTSRKGRTSPETRWPPTTFMSFLTRLACRWRNGFFSIIVMFPSVLVTSMFSCKGAPVLLCLAIVLCDLHLPQGPDCLDACSLQTLTSRD